ncbi:type II toxin-antitoxin system VapC family toxin [Candidatus Curtissbacteria bacterium]|nr:type II toxin-antitoxin system VapC family toxin [Candidatus Curtissbacteria bacterium]
MKYLLDTHVFLWSLSNSRRLKNSVKEAFTISGFEILPIFFEHALGVYKLPLYHRDPFDRMLISQAKAENLKLISADPKIWRYNIPLLKA